MFVSTPGLQQAASQIQVRSTAAPANLLGGIVNNQHQPHKTYLHYHPIIFQYKPSCSFCVHTLSCTSTEGHIVQKVVPDNMLTCVAWFSFAHIPPDSCDAVPRMSLMMSVFLLAGLHPQTQEL
jgi:hypothetical protein